MASLEASSKEEEHSPGDSVSASVSVESALPASISAGSIYAGKITAVFGDITISSNFDSGMWNYAILCIDDHACIKVILLKLKNASTMTDLIHENLTYGLPVIVQKLNLKMGTDHGSTLVCVLPKTSLIKYYGNAFVVQLIPMFLVMK